jgi:circadian clock protein KaiC
VARLSRARPLRSSPSMLPKSPTGIRGFDQITLGGLPRGRPSLVCGGPGCGKTLFAMEFLARGAMTFGEPGVFVSFEERPDELAQNMKSMGIDLKDLQSRGMLVIDHVKVNRSDIEENGEYDLEGLFIRLGHAIDSVGAKRVALDTIESLFSALSDTAVLRSELRRLFGWLKDRGVTAVITGEKGDGTLTRQGLEEYVSDCVIVLDHRLSGNISTRRIQVVKYRGTMHGTNEYPFLIEEHGISILPVTSVGLAYPVGTERVSSGIKELDAMLKGGFYKGSSILVSGTAGTGKTSLGASFVREASRAGGRCLYFAFEEAASQIVRNMRSIGLDLDASIRGGRLKILTSRPQLHGLEMHLAVMHRAVEQFEPAAVVIDPLTSLMLAGDRLDVSALVLRLVDFLKERGITALFTSLTHGNTAPESTEIQVSSLMDTWLMVRDIELGGERNRGLYVLKSRGMGHSNQIREFLITSEGIRLIEPYLGPEGVLTGSARVAQESRERQNEALRRSEYERARSEASRRKQALAAQILALQAEMESLDREGDRTRAVETARGREAVAFSELMARSRRAEGNGSVKRGARLAQKGAVR